MRKPKLTNEERTRLLNLADKKNALVARRRKLYNKLYRKSAFFRSAWAIRLLFIALFVLVAVFFNKTTRSKKEKILSSHVESIKTVSGHGTYDLTTLFLQTNVESYSSNFTDFAIPVLNVNDSIHVERNFFGKPIYFTNPGWNWKYSIDSTFYLYFAILMLTFISFFFNDGLDRFTTNVLWFTLIVDIITTLLFFIF
ncbi:MAG: hypothetical protein V4506_00455 [Bacteroidota bacterium]